MTVELSDLASLSRDDLVERWVRAFGTPPPKGSHARLLVLALAWQEQMANHLGSADPMVLLRALQRSSAPKRSALASGTRLLREWQGRTHEVKVLDTGFEYDGTGYRSLSAIARRITGTAWSGPLFFGLRK